MISLYNQKFGRLTVIGKEPRITYLPNGRTNKYYWLCECECGTKKEIRADALRGDIQSCGCLQKEMVKLIGINNRKFTPEISAARQIYKHSYNDGDISFDKFFELSQLNCYYCNAPPLLKISQNNDSFAYNGLDRIDSSKGHIIDNVVSCCSDCNMSKNILSGNEFYEHIQKIILFRLTNWNNDFQNITIPFIEIENVNFEHHNNEKIKEIIIGAKIGRWTILKFIKNEIPGKSPFYLCKCECGVEHIVARDSLKKGKSKSCGGKICKSKFDQFIVSMKKVWHLYKRGWEKKWECDLEFEKFIKLSQMNCFYCDSHPANQWLGEDEKYYNYNGLDRMDPTKGHTADNVIPCCITCNRMKWDRTIKEFDMWITTVYNVLKDKT